MAALAFLSNFFGRAAPAVAYEPAPSQQAAAMALRIVAGKPEVLLVTSLDTGRWVLPKGWIEENEAAHLTAQREALEEAGISGRADPKPIGCFSYTKRRPRRGDQLCRVDVYRIGGVTERAKWPEKKQRKRRWFSMEEAARLVEEPELAALFAGLGADTRS